MRHITYLPTNMRRRYGRGNGHRLLGALLILSLSLMLLAGCGGSTSNVKEVPMDELAETLAAAETDLPDMDTVTDEKEGAQSYFETVCALPYDEVEHFFISWATAGTADEIVVVLTKSDDSAKEAETALEAHRQKREAMYDQYDPPQAKRAAGGLTFQIGPYAGLIITEHPDDVLAAMKEAVATE